MSVFSRILAIAAIGLAGLAGAAVARQAIPTADKTGAQIVDETCVACHGKDLAGGSAPSLYRPQLLSLDDETLTGRLHRAPGSVPAHAVIGTLSDRQVFEVATYLRIKGGDLTPKPYAGDPNGQVVRGAKQAFRIETVARGLDTPWGVAFLPDGRILVTERTGRLRVIQGGKLLSAPVRGTPAVFAVQDGGLLDVRLHPDYARNGWIYLSYAEVLGGYRAAPNAPAPKPGAAGNPPTMTVVVRGKLTADNRWIDQQVIFRAPASIYTPATVHYGSRLFFDGQGHLFFAIGDRGVMANAQSLASPLGKIHRLNDDGSIPADNPFVATPGAVGSVWSYGHRNADGLAVDPRSGLMWGVEHGPNGGDELNIIEKGGNYGWGVASLGLQRGIVQSHAPGMIDPITHFTPSIAASGIGFYAGDRYPGWKNSLFLSGLVGQKLQRFEVDDRQIAARETVFDQFGRVRTVETGPSGLLYVLLQAPTGSGTGLALSASTAGALVRLVPLP